MSRKFSILSIRLGPAEPILVFETGGMDAASVLDHLSGRVACFSYPGPEPLLKSSRAWNDWVKCDARAGEMQRFDAKTIVVCIADASRRNV